MRSGPRQNGRCCGGWALEALEWFSRHAAGGGDHGRAVAMLRRALALVARGFDKLGHVGTQEREIIVDLKPPTLLITAPPNG